MLTALLAVVLFTVAALVIDLGNARDVRRQSQNAVDSSALAGANVLYPTGACPSGGAAPCIIAAVAAVKAYAASNFRVTPADWTSCTVDVKHPALTHVVSGESPCISFDSSTSPRLVRVYLPRRAVPVNFGALVGTSSISIRSFAEAKAGASVYCSLCFLGPVDAGNADFTVVGGSIGVNGDALGGPNSNWTGDAISVVGTASAGTFSPAVIKIASFTDPLASFPLPLSTTGLATGRTNPCNDAAHGGGPGIYASAVAIPKTTCTLLPGLYVISNSWGMGNNSLLEGTGVTLYVKKPGSLDFKNGDVDLSAGAAGPAASFAIIYDRDNTNDVGLQGNGSTSINGGVYAPASMLAFNGNSCFGFSGGPVIVNGVVKANGNKSCVEITSPSAATIANNPTYLDR